MTRRSLLTAAPALIGLRGFGQTTTEAAKRGQKLLDEMIAALGGDKFLNMKDRLEDGRAYSFYREQLTGLARARIYTRYLDEPDRPERVAQRERQSFGKEEDYYILFLEDKGYSVTFRGARPLLPDRWTRYLESTRRNIFYLLRKRLKEPGMLFEHRGSSVWQNTPVESVDITDADNNVITVFVQATSKLPLRQIWVRRDPKTKERDEYSSIFSKYRDVGDGIQWPYNIVSMRNAQRTFEIFSESVTVNQDLKDDLFLLGSSTKILPPEKP